MALFGDRKEVKHHLLTEETADFLKGFAITIGFFAASTLLVLIPPTFLGGVLALTVGPYIAGYKGGHHVLSWAWLGILSGVIWTSVQVMAIVTAASYFSIYGAAEIGGFEALLVFLLFIFNISFCTIGAKIGSEARQKKAREEHRRSRSSRA